MWWQIAIASALTLPAIGAIVWWGLALGSMQRTQAILGSADDGLTGTSANPPIIIVVPAHNEQNVIGGLIASLRGQDYSNFRVVLALDRCTDQTLASALDTINSDDRFEIVEVTECPRDWAGKVHAIHAALSGRESVPHEVLLFADADTIFHPSCVRSCVNLLESRALDALTLLSTLTYDRGFERRVQAPASMELLVRYPPRKASRDRRRRPFANGQFILIRRSAYEKIGRHEAFREELLEDLAIARALWRERLRVHVLRAGKMLACRMYPDPAAFRRGWTRIFIEAAKRKPTRLRAWSIGVATRGFVQPFGCILGAMGSFFAVWMGWSPWVFAIAGGLSAIGLVFWLASVHQFLLLCGVDRWWKRVAIVLWWPFGSLELAGLLRRAAADLRRGIPTGWAGKNYVRPAR
ncbi:MAG: glycosyltransferase [Phycisphaeraceae bacterium]|nr:glycosyltransferase [Phycisphaeraceae bacterium]